MRTLLVVAALVAAPSLAHAHHEALQEAATALNFGWPILTLVAGAMVAQVRSWLR